MTMHSRLFLWLGGLCLLAGPCGLLGQTSNNQFRWPEGKRVAVSLSFDDARASQVDAGLPLLDKYGVKATFYVNPTGAKWTTRLAGWKKAVTSGHEIGNHTVSHPCAVNYTFSASNALEDYTLPMIEKQMVACNVEVERALGVKPATFAYPCGCKFIGRGVNVQSYVPLAAKLFLAARGFWDEGPNDPARCDLAQVTSVISDGLTGEQVLSLVSAAAAQHFWLVFAGHEIGPIGVQGPFPGRAGYQTTMLATIEQLMKYASDPANGVWLDTVQNIAKYIQAQRSGSK